MDRSMNAIFLINSSAAEGTGSILVSMSLRMELCKNHFSANEKRRTDVLAA